ncbi:hypothetical protein SCODD09_00960 [Streptococcus constellatus]|nr:hypothetical protein SCODD09_00960 [Streptococcus constellatus]
MTKESEKKFMETAVRVVNAIGTIGGLVGLGWAAWGIWDLATGIRREDDIKKDRGITSVLLGAVLGVALKAIFSAVAAGIQSFNF